MRHCGKPVAFMVANINGEEWKVCAEHGAQDCPGARWVLRTSIGDWYLARAMPLPADPGLCNEATREPDA